MDFNCNWTRRHGPALCITDHLQWIDPKERRKWLELRSVPCVESVRHLPCVESVRHLPGEEAVAAGAIG